MKIRSMEFELSAVRPVQWPEDGLPEFAFVGRSNVGKSSLLNRLLNRKSLARVSGQPGKTQQINFYRINDNFRFADLPGYGYAQVSKKQRTEFVKMMDTYLTKRKPLQLIFHLIDIRHDPSKDDVERHRWFVAAGLPVCIVATKADKISRSKVKPSLQRIQTVLHSPYPCLAVSSEKGTGIEDLWSQIQHIVEPVSDNSNLNT